MQAERYDLSKQVQKVSYDGKRLSAWKKGDFDTPVINELVKKDELANHIGKDAAEKLLNQPEKSGGFRTLEGLELKVGGKGMIAFYDKIVPNAVSKLVKKLDRSAKVERTSIPKPVDRDGGLPESMQSIRTDVKIRERNALANSKYGQNFDELSPNRQAFVLQELGGQLETLSIQITPKMREKILGEGQSLFSGGGVPLPGQDEKPQGHLAQLLAGQ